MNIFTATPDALLTLSPQMTLEKATQLNTAMASRAIIGEQLSEYLRSLELEKLSGYTQKSDFFLVKSTIQIDDLSWVVYSLLQDKAHNQEYTVIWRSRGTW